MWKDKFIILIITLLIIIIWVAAEVYHTRSQKISISPNLQEVLDPISPNFDTDTLQQAEERMAQNPMLFLSPLPLPTLQPLPSTRSASPTPTPRARTTPTPTPLRR